MIAISDDRLYKLLVEPGHIVREDFLRAKKKSGQSGRRIEKILVEEALILDEQIGRLVAEDRAWPFINLRQEKIDEKVLNLVPELMARNCRLIAFSRDETTVKIAMADPDDFETVHNLSKRLAAAVKVFFVTDDDLDLALRYYKKDIKREISALISQIEDSGAGQGKRDEGVIKIVDELIQHGFYNRASDIHIEPLSDHVGIRFRIDGVMHHVADLPRLVYEPVLRRIKIMARMRTDEQRAAQDGKFKFLTENEEIDVRVSVMPVTRGENIVMRLLSNTNQQLSMDSLGLSFRDFKIVESALAVPHGMILVTGPTGSGKTTTLYEFVKTINSEEVHIASIEDPVEYDMEGVSQIQVDPKSNLTFAKGLRAIIRQDPDVIMIGEIRDQETAKIAVNSAMTGHLVLSTLHTNDSATALPRLLDMGIEPYLIASTVNIIIAQRLARKVCEKCRYSYAITDKEKGMIRARPELVSLITVKMKKNLDSLTLFKGEGCRVCANTGFSGRLGIFEILKISDQIRDLILRQRPSSEITKAAVGEGMASLVEDGLAKAFNGQTTIDEVLRVTSGPF